MAGEISFRGLDGGGASFFLRVIHNRKSKVFSLNRAAFSHEWNSEAGRFRKNYPDSAAENDVLRTYEQRASDAIRGFERDGCPFNFEDFERAVFVGRQTPGGASVKVVDLLLSVRDAVSADSFGNSRFYQNTAAVVRDFRPKATLAEVNSEWLEKFEAWQRKRGIKDGGISVNMRVLRAACNRAVKSKIMPRDWYPFAAYSIAHLKGANVKRAITLAEVRSLEALDAVGPERFALDLFLFSFYCRGMNFADIADLQRTDVREGRIFYRRKKTGKSYSVPVSERAAAILSRYERPGEAYLFPIYTAGVHVTDQQRFNRAHKVAAQVNGALKALAVRAGIAPDGFVFYTARHTYATALKHRGVAVEVISQALGHADLKTTEIYLKSFGDDVLDAADDLLA